MSVEQQIRERLVSAFSPQWIELENESHQHSVPANSETHFRLVLVSEAFVTKRAVARHQHVYRELGDFLDGPVHALAMHLYDPVEWAQRQGETPISPACMGGSNADAGGVGG